MWLPLLIHDFVVRMKVVHMIEVTLLEIIYLLLFGLISETICVFALIIVIIILSKQKIHICNCPFRCVLTYLFWQPRLWFVISYCVNNKVPGYPPTSFACVGGWGSYVYYTLNYAKNQISGSDDVIRTHDLPGMKKKLKIY